MDDVRWDGVRVGSRERKEGVRLISWLEEGMPEAGNCLDGLGAVGESGVRGGSGDGAKKLRYHAGGPSGTWGREGSGGSE